MRFLNGMMTKVSFAAHVGKQSSVDNSSPHHRQPLRHHRQATYVASHCAGNIQYRLSEDPFTETTVRKDCEGRLILIEKEKREELR